MKEMGIEDKLCQFIQELGDDLSNLELLMFFSRHPNTRFNRVALLHAVSSRRFDTGLALKRLIDKKIVVSNTENGITLYSLTREEPMHSLAADLITIDQHQWQQILEYILDANGIQE